MSLRLVHVFGWAPHGEDPLAVVHRMQRPLELLHSHYGVSGDIYWALHPDALPAAAAADITVLHLVYGLPWEALVLRRRQAGRATLFELGDDPAGKRPWARQPQRPVAQLQSIYHLASLCDGVQFSARGLEEKFRPLHGRRAVLPQVTAVPAALPERQGPFTIGWSGSTSHREDLESVAPVVADFCRRHSDVQLAVKGSEGMLREVFAGVPPAQLVVEPYGPQAEYEAFQRRLHVGLAPLRPTAINRGRTDLKLVEYGAAGAVAVAQRAPAFKDLAEHVLLFDTGEELRHHLQACYADPAMCRRRREAMLQHLQSARAAAPLAQQHWSWYRSFTPASPVDPPPAGLTAQQTDSTIQRMMALPADSNEREQVLRDLLRTIPAYAACRLQLAQVLLQLERADEAAQLCRPLLRNPFWHDEALLLLAGAAQEPVRRRLPRLLRSPLLRAEMAPRSQITLHAYFRGIQAASAMHFFMLGYMARNAPTPAEQEEAKARLALYDTSN